MWLIPVALAQNSSDTWRTVETDHFRVHYPAQAEPWALYAAARMDDIRVRTSEEIGYAPPQVIDVVVMDPYAMANGWAMPSLRRPRMGLYASPPPAHSVLGHYRSWAEDLVVHEDAHQVHLLMPSRSPVWDQLSYWTLGIGPMGRKSPRWVAEGYATVIEGRLTGWGRPNSRGRQVFLATLARYGEFPTYDELNMSSDWQGGSYAYLVGSAFLEWLEATHGEESVRQLWVAMTARSFRSFHEAFVAVYGEEPEVLYKQFVTWVTFGAVWPEVWKAPLEDSVWLEIDGSTGAPALSPDGERVAYVDRSGVVPRLVIQPLAEDEEARTAWEEEDAKRLEKDPEDVLIEPPRVFHQEPEHRRARPDRPPNFPRWVDDERLIFTAWWSDEGGNFVPDLYLWTPGEGERRVTHGAAVLAADPHPRRDVAIGVRTRWGSSQLVEVDLETGEVVELGEARPDVVHDSPRYSPDGQAIVYLLDDATVGWRLIHRELASGEEQELELPLGVTPTSPEWTPDGTAVLVSVGDAIWRVPLDGGPREVLVDRITGAFTPAVTPDGSALFFLSMHPEGLDLHRVELEGRATSPVVAEAMDEPPPPPVAEEVEPGRYAPGLPWVQPIPGLLVDGSGFASEIGLHVADRAGRSEVNGWLAINGDGVPAASLFYANHAYPVRLGVGAGWEGLKDDRDPVLLLSAAADERWEGGAADAEVGVYSRDSGDKVASTLRGRVQHTRWFGPGFALAGFEGRAQVAGGQSTDTQALWHADGALGAGVWGFGVVGSAGLGSSTGAPFVVGGIPYSSSLGGTSLERLYAPGLAQGALVARRHAVSRVDVGAPGVLTLFGERHVDLDEGDRVSWVGLQVRLDSPPIPMDMRPAAHLDVGVANQLRYPAGPAAEPFRRKEDYRVWASLTWTPRIE